MNNSARLVDTEKFNSNVESWTISARNNMTRRAPIGARSVRDEDKLIGTRSFVNLNKEGEAYNLKFLIPRHGVFVHYGVGRGWIRVGNSIVRGSLTKSARSRKSKNRRVVLSTSAGTGRQPLDWFDIVIKQGIGQLANIAQEYYGDKAMNSILDKSTRFLIEK